MELNKIIQDLKKEVETMNKTQSEKTLEIETLGKKSGAIDASISNRMQEMEGNPGHNEKTKPMNSRSR
jgi:predicted  nucleic acid-binding Zn-ribbon protein